jgi:hypothetical protein
MEHARFNPFNACPASQESGLCFDGTTDPPINCEYPVPAVTDLDQHMMDIVSAYIARIPDAGTKKHIARMMINFIIKSAKL